jgi:hypothetical protein
MEKHPISYVCESKLQQVPDRNGRTPTKRESFYVAAIRITCSNDEPLVRRFGTRDDSHREPIQEDCAIWREVGEIGDQ